MEKMNSRFYTQTKQTCMSDCNYNPKYNPYLKCGGISTPIEILGGNTDTARCIEETKRAQNQCKVDCENKHKDTK